MYRSVSTQLCRINITSNRTITSSSLAASSATLLNHQITLQHQQARASYVSHHYIHTNQSFTSSSSLSSSPNSHHYRIRMQRLPIRTFSSDPSSSSSSSSSASSSSQPSKPSILPSASSSTQSAIDISNKSDELESDPIPTTWWGRWTHESPMPTRGSFDWYIEMAILFTVFGVTGSTSMYVVKPLVTQLIGVEGTMMDGPWSYRIACIGLLMPAYSIMLVTFGTLAGRHHFFRRQALKMWGRIIPLHKLGIKAKPPPIATNKSSTAPKSSTTP